MKRLVSLALSAALVLSLLAGCGNSTDPQTTGTATTGGNEGTGEAKDTIVWAQSGDINSLDFHVGKQYLSYGVTCNIFDTLVSWDADNNVIPMLATEWEFLDEDSIQFKLREGVTFHDGEPFTAEWWTTTPWSSTPSVPTPPCLTHCAARCAALCPSI